MGPGEGGPHSPLTVPSLRPPTLPLLSPSPVFPPCFLSFLLHFLLPFLNGGLGRAVMVLFPALPSWARQTTTKVQEKDAFQVPLSSEPKSVTHWLLPREGSATAPGWLTSCSVPQGSGMMILVMTSGCPMAPHFPQGALRKPFFTME